jgi:hypothetical protein
VRSQQNRTAEQAGCDRREQQLGHLARRLATCNEQGHETSCKQHQDSNDTIDQDCAGGSGGSHTFAAEHESAHHIASDCGGKELVEERPHQEQLCSTTDREAVA